MRHSLPQSHQFYVTAPQPCPYLAGKVERKLFTALQGDGAAPPERRALAPGLPPLAERALPPVLRRLLGLPLGAHRGRRTSRPPAASAGCCGATRDLERVARSPWATEAQYALFRRYLDARHATGGMADMDMHEFAAMIEETPGAQPGDRVLPPRARRPAARELAAVCLTDLLSDGVSMVYSFFDPDLAARQPRQLHHPRPRRDRPRGGAAVRLSRLLGARQRRRWTTRPATSRSRSSPRAAGAALGAADTGALGPPPRRPPGDQRAGRRDRAPRHA